MILDFFKPKIKVINYCLFNTDKNWKFSKELINELLAFMKMQGIKIKYFSATTEKYKDIGGKIDNLSKLNIPNLVLLLFYDEKIEYQTEPILSVAISMPNSIVISIEETKKLDFSKLIINSKDHFNPIYGFCYLGVKGKLSTNYLYQKTNVNYLLDIQKKGQREFDLWFHNRTKIADSLLRDIYRENFLNQNHIQNICSNGMQLLDLIRSNSKYGSIEKVCENGYLWKVEEENLAFVRGKLYQERFVIVGNHF